jgi:hypothetical protein
MCYLSICHLLELSPLSEQLYLSITVFGFKEHLFYSVMIPKHKSSDADNLDAKEMSWCISFKWKGENYEGKKQIIC